MKIKRKKILLIIFLTFISTFVYWYVFIYNNLLTDLKKLDYHSINYRNLKQMNKLRKKNRDYRIKNEKLTSLSQFKEIDCLVNDEYNIKCFKSIKNQTIYLPFTFIKKYFEIYGKFSRLRENKEVFLFQHSYSKVYYPIEEYNFKKKFLWFENYFVENRDRVKYVCGKSGVPISVQWNTNGHFYPIQIAQFGLNHLSKYYEYGLAKSLTLYSKKKINSNWQAQAFDNHLDQVELLNEANKTFTFLFINGEKIVFNLNLRKDSLHYNDLYFSFKYKIMKKLKIQFVLKNELNTTFFLNYENSNYDNIKNGIFVYGFGNNSDFSKFNRNLGVDLIKSINLSQKKINLIPKIKKLRLIQVIFSGQAYIDNVELSANGYLDNFLKAVNWFINNQDEQNGWPIKVNRKLVYSSLFLKSGWYSAMSQGQAISLLVRMYHYCNDNTKINKCKIQKNRFFYLNAAIKATDLYSKNVTDNGIRTFFMNKYVWYEEYPTIPSLYVLNGFIYSLFGLYDLKMTLKQIIEFEKNNNFLSEYEKLKKLFSDGILSLKNLMHLFDTGSSTLYDLRHFTLKVSPNIARWDYHTTHINLLLHLNTILNDQNIDNCVQRWIGYLKGKRAAHN